MKKFLILIFITLVFSPELYGDSFRLDLNYNNRSSFRYNSGNYNTYDHGRNNHGHHRNRGNYHDLWRNYYPPQRVIYYEREPQIVERVIIKHVEPEPIRPTGYYKINREWVEPIYKKRMIPGHWLYGVQEKIINGVRYFTDDHTTKTWVEEKEVLVVSSPGYYKEERVWVNY